METCCSSYSETREKKNPDRETEQRKETDLLFRDGILSIELFGLPQVMIGDYEVLKRVYNHSAAQNRALRYSVSDTVMVEKVGSLDSCFFLKGSDLDRKVQIAVFDGRIRIWD